ncbi:MAG TPA: hypothetical protein VG269_09590 [Tepidisphaeraceae bacterium]|jgi:hypothetical protein|nr:hypothetical protein [Tepidisphaeraceae bacterium]
MTIPHDNPGKAPATLAQDHAVATRRLARLVLATFIFTFVIARLLVIFIMDGKLPPQLFFHVKGTHVHHLNYGIFLLSIAGAYLLFARPAGSRLGFCAVVYAIGLGLTFDEFGMWLHLGGPYWQRASYDAVITIAAVLALIAYGSQIRHWRPKHYTTLLALAVLLIAFGFALSRSMKWANQTIGPRLYHLEERGPS